MTRTGRLILSVLTFTVLASGFSALAQEHKIEAAVGLGYPMFNNKFKVESTLSLRGRVEYRFNAALSAGVLLEQLDTKDNTGAGGDAKVTLYGATGTWVLAGEPLFQLFATGSLGTGKLEYDLKGTYDLPKDVDFTYFYEVGAGTQFIAGKHLNFRLQVVFRRYKPEENSMLIASGRTAIVPTFDICLRF